MSKEHAPEKKAEPAPKKEAEADPSAPYREEALHPKDPPKEEGEKE